MIYTPRLEDAQACIPGLRRVRVAGALVDVSIISLRGWEIVWFARPDPEFCLYRIKVARALVEVGLYSILIKNIHVFVDGRIIG